MTDHVGASTKQNRPIRFMGTDLLKERVQNHARSTGVDQAKIIRRALREFFEKTGELICPACFETVGKKGFPGQPNEVEWHVHNGIEIHGGMWW